MLKIRLKKTGRKRYPHYRIVIMENAMKRDGRSIDELGFYNPISKKLHIDYNKIKKWLKKGAKPTVTVNCLIKRSDFNKT